MIVSYVRSQEDYELLFTISQEDYGKIENQPNISVIGYITEQSKGNYIIAADGSEILLEAQGCSHI